jgi:hypothetical protein
LGVEAAELEALVRDGGGLVRSVDEDGSIRCRSVEIGARVPIC